MKLLLKNALVLNVFTATLEKENVLIEDDRILGVGDYEDHEADAVEDLEGKILTPGLIDGHIHIESTMLTPYELAKVCLLHGTTAIVADPHEIANVCGLTGIDYMLQAGNGLPLRTFIKLPSCVPATMFDESGAVLEAEDLAPYYEKELVVGLAEMMNYPGVLFRDSAVLKKLSDARERKMHVDGHAPLLSAKELDRYLFEGIRTDHECSTAKEAIEKIRKGQWIMIREGTAAKNLDGLIELFEEPYWRRCLLVTDDRHPADLISEGHIDHIVRLAVKKGVSPIRALQMASLGAAQCFGFSDLGAVAPGYRADLVAWDGIESLNVHSVYSSGKKVVSNGILSDFPEPTVSEDTMDKVCHSFHLDALSEEDFHLNPTSDRCRVIRVLEGQLITEEWITSLDFSKSNGIDLARDVVKLAVIERHHNTGHIGLGFLNGIGLKRGAIASSVSHDSHNLIVLGTNEKDMALAANHIRKIGGGNVVVCNGEILAEMALPVAGLMASKPADVIARENEAVRRAADTLGTLPTVEPFMNLAFVSLPVIPHLKMTPQGLVDVDRFERVPLFV